MRPAILLLFSLFLGSLLQAQDLNNLKFTTYTTQNGLANNLTRDLAVDRHGYLWVSQHSGISRFDGVKFTNYPFDEDNPHGLRYEQECSFELDGDGRFWVCNSAGICWFDEKSDRFNYVDPKDTTFEFVPRRFKFDGKETIWISGGDGLYQLNTKTLEIKRTKAQGMAAYSLDIDPSGNIWFTVFLTGLYCYNPQNEKLQFYPRMANIAGIYIDDKGLVWLPESNKMTLFDPRTDKFEEFSAGAYYSRGLRGITAEKMCTVPKLTGQDVLWIPGFGNGIVLFDTKTRRFSGCIKHDPLQPNGLPPVDLLGIGRFSESVVWLTSDQGGLIKLDLNDQQFQPLRFPFMGEETLGAVNRILPDKADPAIWWVAIQGGGLVRYHTQTRQVLQWQFKDRDALNIDDIVYDQKGALWMAAANGAAYSNDNGKSFRFLTLSAKDAPPAAMRIVPIGQDELWILVVGGVVLYNTRTGQSRFSAVGRQSMSTMSGQALSDILPDAQGNLITSGFYGIHRVDRLSGKVEKLTEADYGEEGDITGAYEMAFDKKGKLWFGTRGSLGCYDPSTGKTEFFNDKNGFLKTVCYYVFFDQEGFLWLLTSQGLCRMDTEARTYKWYTATGGASYLRNYTGVVRGRSKIGNEYLITLLSANFRFDPLLADKNDAPANPHISQFKVRNQFYPFDIDEVAKTPLVLNYNQNFLSFDFTALNYTQPERMTFRYKLDGLDEDWTETNLFRTVNYPKLAPGTYTFKVFAANSAGVWDQQPAVFKVKIRPPWWAGLWFRLLIFGALAYAAYFYFQNRIKKIRSQVEIREREAGYKQREAELQREVAEFSRQVAEVELAALRAQMNPHFVFNCLNSINTFILLNDPKNASGYLQKFSKLIRKVLDASRSEFISLHDELETLRYYIELEQMRYGGRFQYQFSIQDNLPLDDLELPPMLVQPFVENAIWHGLMNRDGDGGMLLLDISRQANTLCIIVEDNGIGRKKAADLKSRSAVAHKSHGLQVTDERIKIINELYSTQASVEILDLLDPQGVAQGTRVTLKIPLEGS